MRTSKQWWGGGGDHLRNLPAVGLPAGGGKAESISGCWWPDAASRGRQRGQRAMSSLLRMCLVAPLY